MNKFLSKIFGFGDDNKEEHQVMGREELERKVEEGANKAIKEYKETFDILSEYDRSE